MESTVTMPAVIDGKPHHRRRNAAMKSAASAPPAATASIMAAGSHADSDICHTFTKNAASRTPRKYPANAHAAAYAPRRRMPVIFFSAASMICLQIGVVILYYNILPHRLQEKQNIFRLLPMNSFSQQNLPASPNIYTYSYLDIGALKWYNIMKD